MSTEIIEQKKNGIIDNVSILTNGDLFDRLMKISEVMAKSGAMVPQHFRDQPDACMAITMQAARWGMDPFVVAQKTHLVNGTLGYEAQLVNAIINSMAPTKDRIHFEWFGPWENILGCFVEKTGKSGNKYIAPGWSLADEKGVGVRAWATLKGEDEPRELVLYLSQAQVRNSTLWASDPRQQLAYLSVKRWARLYCPDVILGIYSDDELLEPTPRAEKDITPVASAVTELDSPPTSTEPDAGKAAELAEALSAALDEASTQEEAATIEQRIAKHKDALGSSLLFSLRGKAQKKRSGFRGVSEIDAAFSALDGTDNQKFQQLETLVANWKNALPPADYERFTLALDDLRPEYQQ
ncbi:RecT family recombinase [Serratia odorifera]|uniref:RecT family protein n=2 Tax=Serratia odorifera TaxID=618 RepID=D4E7I3_SEROD|nr:RecT family protein [Serratia odorifera DSM 4582]VDZ64198.1 RecT family [Serratia odorifera]